MTWPEAFAFVGLFSGFFAIFAFFLYTEMKATEARCRMLENLRKSGEYSYKETRHD